MHMTATGHRRMSVTGNPHRRWVVFFVSILLFLPLSPVHAVEIAPRISDREIVERLARLEEGQKQLQIQMNQRFDAIEKRFEGIDARFESIDARFESIDARFESMETGINARFASLEANMNAQFDRLVNIMVAIVAAFAAVVASTIGFAVWDRRTMIRPFEIKVKAIEEAFSEHREQVHALIETMKTLSKRDEHVAEVLRQFHLL